MFKNKINLDDNCQLIHKLRTGDGKCFDALYRHYFSGLCAFAHQYVTTTEAEEIVQDTMLWLWENKATLIPEMSLKSLLFTIVKNKSLNKLTRKQIKSRVHQQIIEKFECQFEDPDFYLEAELSDLFKNALDKLPIEYRKAFEMNRTEGFTHKEIAQKLAVSRQTVNYRISQALKVLRLELKDYLPML